MIDIKIYVEETLRTPGDKNKKKATPRHILVKLLKTKDRENLKSIQKEKKIFAFQEQNSQKKKRKPKENKMSSK